MTNEPFQPVRLYYSIPGRAFAAKALGGLQCVAEAPEERCFHWLYCGEAASLPLGDGYDSIPAERRPISLGRIRFPSDSRMVLQTNSVARAVAAAQFFAPRFGPKCTAIRLRIVNRLFAAEEGPPDVLMKSLDENVSVRDPREAEAAFERKFEGVRTLAEAERVAAEDLKRKLESKEDVPLVEDFPLAPEEETPDFQHLTIALHLRFARAVEHWRGNVDVTLTALIVRMVEQAGGRPGV